MNSDLVAAIALLQARVSRYESLDHWHTELCEEALNLLVAEPHRQGDVRRLVLNALVDARRKLSRRAEILSLHGAEIDWLSPTTVDDFAHLLVELTDFLGCLSPIDQALLYFACRGEPADKIAISLGIPIARVREKLSRARARARMASGSSSHRQRPRRRPKTLRWPIPSLCPGSRSIGNYSFPHLHEVNPRTSLA